MSSTVQDLEGIMPDQSHEINKGRFACSVDTDLDKLTPKNPENTDSDEQTTAQGYDSDLSPATRRQLSFLSSPPETPYIGLISPPSSAISSEARLDAMAAAASVEKPAGSAVPFDINAEDAGAIGTEPRTEKAAPAAAAARPRRAPAIRDANHPEPYLIKAVIGQDIQDSRLLPPTPISHRIHPSSLDQQFIDRLANLAKTTTEGTDLVKSLNDIIGLNITEDVLTEDLKARLFHNDTSASLVFRSLVPLLPPRRGQLEKGKADSEIDSILLFERNGCYSSLVISCKSDYTRGRIGDEIKHLTKWTDLGFSIQLETGIKTEVPPEVFPIKDTVIKQYPALHGLVKSYPEEESLIARLLAAAKPRWIKVVLSPNPDQNNNIPRDAIRTDTVLGPRLIHILLSLSEFRELNEIILSIIRKLPIDYHRSIPPQYLSCDPIKISRTLEQELETCSTPPIIEKKSSELTRIAAHLNHLQSLQQLAESKGQPELAACLALRLQTSLRNIPAVAQKMQELKDKMEIAEEKIFITQERSMAGLAEPNTGLLALGRRSRKSSMHADSGTEAAGASEPVAIQLKSTAPGGVFHAYAPATASGAGATETGATPAIASEDRTARSEARFL